MGKMREMVKKEIGFGMTWSISLLSVVRKLYAGILVDKVHSD